jgi:hypothetical protein
MNFLKVLQYILVSSEMRCSGLKKSSIPLDFSPGNFVPSAIFHTSFRNYFSSGQVLAMLNRPIMNFSFSINLIQAAVMP